MGEKEVQNREDSRMTPKFWPGTGKWVDFSAIIRTLECYRAQDLEAKGEKDGLCSFS